MGGWGGSGVTLCHNEVTRQIFMSFLPPVDCLLKTLLTKGGSRAPQDPPGFAQLRPIIVKCKTESLFLV